VTLHRLDATLSATEGQGRITGVEAEIVLAGEALAGPTLAKLQAAAESCRISRALNVPVSSRITLG
jgi:organic hydroperoxide reductase OsmC/OhrA